MSIFHFRGFLPNHLNFRAKRRNFELQNEYGLSRAKTLFGYLPRTILEWDRDTSSFFSKGPKCKCYWVWYFNVFVVAGLIGIGSCLDVIRNYSETGLTHCLVCGALTCLSLMLQGQSLVSVWYVEPLVTGLNAMTRFRNVHVSRTDTNRLQSTRLWKRLSLVLQLVIGIFGVLPFFLTPGLIYGNLEAFVYTLPKLISFGQSYVLFLLRLILSSICIWETCRYFAFMFSVVGLWLEADFSVLDNFSHNEPRNITEMKRFIEEYTAFQVIKQVGITAVNQMIAVLMAVGFLIFVMSNIGTVRAYNLLPWYLYWLMPTVSGVCTFFICLFTPMAIKTGTRSRELLRYNKQMLQNWVSGSTKGRDVKATLARFDSLQPTELSCGSFYKLKHGSDITYMYWVLLRSIDCLLIPYSDRHEDLA